MIFTAGLYLQGLLHVPRFSKFGMVLNPSADTPNLAQTGGPADCVQQPVAVGKGVNLRQSFSGSCLELRLHPSKTMLVVCE